MNDPVISILCTAYNHENYIVQAIESFLEQKTSFPFEIVIHDDASTDNTAAIITRYAEEYPDKITAIIQKENQYSQGIKPFAEYVIPRARGKYVAICEGDDYWADENKLQKQVDFLEANPDYVVCYHDAVIIDEKGRLVCKSKLPDAYKRDFSADELKRGAWALTLTLCFRNVIQTFPEELHTVRNGDTFLISMLGNFGQGKYMDRITNAVYRQHSQSVWSSLSLMRKNMSSLHTFAQLSTYYSRIGDKKYADYYQAVVLKMVHDIVERWYDPENDEFCRLFTEQLDAHKHIIDSASLPAVQAYIGKDVVYKLALMYVARKNYNEAIAWFGKAAEINPQDETVYNNMGVLYYRTQRYGEARVSFKKALELNPHYRDAQKGLETVCLKQKSLAG